MFLFHRKQEWKERNGTKFEDIVSAGIDIIYTTMSPVKARDITNLFKTHMRTVPDSDVHMEQAVLDLKRSLDNTYGLAWQVILLKESYWMDYSHTPLMSIHFEYGPYKCMIWHTRVMI